VLQLIRGVSHVQGVRVGEDERVEREGLRRETREQELERQRDSRARDHTNERGGSESDPRRIMKFAFLLTPAQRSPCHRKR
jgi:hypothetical protein